MEFRYETRRGAKLQNWPSVIHMDHPNDRTTKRRNLHHDASTMMQAILVGLCLIRFRLLPKWGVMPDLGFLLTTRCLIIGHIIGFILLSCVVGHQNQSIQLGQVLRLYCPRRTPFNPCARADGVEHTTMRAQGAKPSAAACAALHCQQHCCIPHSDKSSSVNLSCSGGTCTLSSFRLLWQYALHCPCIVYRAHKHA